SIVRSTIETGEGSLSASAPLALVFADRTPHPADYVRHLLPQGEKEDLPHNVQFAPASFPFVAVAATTSRMRSNTPSASGGQFGERPSRTMTSRSEGTMITYWPIVPLAKNASRGQPRSVR